MGSFFIMTKPLQGPQPDGLPGQPNSDTDRNVAQFAHFGIAILAFVPALIIYLTKKNTPWVRYEAAKAFNFAFILTLIVIIVWIAQFIFTISIVGASLSEALWGIALCTVLVNCVLIQSIYGIINGIRIGNGSETRYPFKIKILK